MNDDHIYIEYVAEDGAECPQKAHADDAAFDLRAYLPGRPCWDCDGVGFLDGAHTEQLNACPTCDGDGNLDSLPGELYLEPRGTCLIPTGIRIALPAGVAAFVLPRSGLALKHGITVLNSPGLIDPGYRGDVGVILHNASDTPFTVNHGDRIAQLLPFRLTPSGFFTMPIPDPSLRGEGEESGRGVGGFGSTGL